MGRNKFADGKPSILDAIIGINGEITGVDGKVVKDIPLKECHLIDSGVHEIATPDLVGVAEHGYTLPPPPITYQQVNHMHPHPERKYTILNKHPEIADLFGYDWRTKYLAVVLVAMNMYIAAQVGMNWESLAWWKLFVLTYVVGAPVNHALAMVIHDASHDLAASSPTRNRWIGIFANLPLGIPSAMSFRRYHLEHHSHLGVTGTDMDLPPFFEVVNVQNISILKMFWMSMFILSYGLRPLFWGRTKLASNWELVNIILEIGTDVLMGFMFGGGAVFYMLVSTVWCFGLHPCAAHFIQEHYTLLGGNEPDGKVQETFSYYGPFNRIILNVGYHNEHHDFAGVPWSRLPEIKRRAPEFYDTLEAHTSVFSIIYDFIARADLGPHARVVRTKEIHNRELKSMLAQRKAVRLAGKKCA